MSRPAQPTEIGPTQRTAGRDARAGETSGYEGRSSHSLQTYNSASSSSGSLLDLYARSPLLGDGSTIGDVSPAISAAPSNGPWNTSPWPGSLTVDEQSGSKRVSTAGFDPEALRSIGLGLGADAGPLKTPSESARARRMNSVPASESDGSHYDDDIDPMPASSAAAGEGKGKISEQPEYGNVTRVAAEQDVEGEEMFMNAPDSPPVPIRRSSRNGAGLHFRSTSLSRPNSLFPSNPIPRRRSSTDSSELLRRQEAQLPGEETAAAGLGIMNPPFADAGVSPKTAGGSLAATLQVANPSGAPQLSVPVEGERRDSAWSNDAAEGDPQDLASGDYPLTAAMDISPTPSHVSNAPSPAPVTPITPASPQAPPRPARSRSENKVSVANSPEKAFEPESEESKSSLLQRAKTSSNRASPMSGFDLSPTTPTASTSAALSPTALSPAAVEAVDPQTQAALEAELLSSADADDPSRPRTLKEARALAKERARLRKQASQANVSPTPDVSSRESTQQSSVVTSPVKEEPTSQPVKEVTRQGRPSLDGERPWRNPRRQSTQDAGVSGRRSVLSDHSAPSDYSHSSEASARPSLEGSRSSLIFHDMDGPYRAHSRGHGQFDSISAPIQETVVAANEKRFGQVPTSSGGMEELTAAVGAALDELGNLSFDSTGSISQRDTSLTSVGSVLAPAQGEIAPSTPHQPRTPSMDTFDPTTPRQASTAEAEPAQIAAVTPTAPTSEAAATPRTIPARSSSTQYSPPKPAPMLARPVQVAPQGTPSATTPTLSQRAQAIARPARIHTYGRTIPWPNAFNPEPILQKRKAAPWERGRAYAQFANELMGTPTGLAAWIEIVQRPAGRRQQAQGALLDASQKIGPPPARSGHVRDEPSYAASVRSDATFPMRGDGGKAKDITPISIGETLPSMIPSNIPYPSLASSQAPGIHHAHASSGGSSTATGSSSNLLNSPHLSPVISMTSRPSESDSVTIPQSAWPDRASTVGKATGNATQTSRGSAGAFFSSLGRKGSKRAAGLSSISVGSGSASGALGSIAGSVSGPRGPRSKGRTISSPMIASPLADQQDTLGALPSSTTSPVGGVPPASRSPGRSLSIVEEQYSQQPQLGRSPGAAPSPLGPRAPGSAATSPFAATVRQYSNPSPRSMQPQASTYSQQTAQQSSPNLLSAPDASMRSPIISAPASAQSPPLTPQLGGGGAGMTTPTFRSSFSYGTVRDRSPGGGRQAGNEHDEAFEEALRKLTDVLPDADRGTLAVYLKKAGGNDLVAIGDYLQDQSKGKVGTAPVRVPRSPGQRNLYQ